MTTFTKVTLSVVLLSLVVGCSGRGTAPAESSDVVGASTTSESPPAPAAVTEASGPAAEPDVIVQDNTQAEIIVAMPDEGAGSSLAAHMDLLLVAAASAYTTPSRTVVFLSDDEKAIIERLDTATTRVVVAAATGTHLRLFDAGNGPRGPVVVYAIVNEDDAASVNLHVVGLDGTNDQGFGEIGMWEGITYGAHLGGGTVVTEEMTDGQAITAEVDLSTGTITRHLHDQSELATISADGTTTARIADGTLLVTRTGAELATATIDLSIVRDTITSIELGPNDIIINTAAGQPFIIRDWRVDPAIDLLGVRGHASFID